MSRSGNLQDAKMLSCMRSEASKIASGADSIRPMIRR